MNSSITGGYHPFVSVLIPMFNSDRWIQDCVSSILQQTYTHFEIVIWDDGSVDNSYAKVQRIKDKRIKLFGNSDNLGTPVVRNKLLSIAKGDLVAWLDSDDYSRSNRLEAQVAKFGANSNLVLLGSWVKWKRVYRLPDGSGLSAGVKYSQRDGITRFAKSDSAIRVRQPIFNQFSTSAVMHRMSTVRDHGLRFDENLWPAEDYSFWNSLMKFGECSNLPYPISSESLGGMSHSEKNQKRQEEAVFLIRERIWQDLGIPAYHRATLSRLLSVTKLRPQSTVTFRSLLAAVPIYASRFPRQLRLRAFFFIVGLGVRVVLRRLTY